jgi:hypothetical protein
MAKLDDVSWHAGGDYFPPGLPDENAATHIGFFVTWTIRNDQWSNFLGPAAAAGIEAVRSGQVSGREFLLRQCDGKLLTEMLKPEFIPFAEPYYRREFTRDYQRSVAVGVTSDYLVEDTEANYRKIAPGIEQRFNDWRTRGSRPWWKFW